MSRYILLEQSTMKTPTWIRDVFFPKEIKKYVSILLWGNIITNFSLFISGRLNLENNPKNNKNFLTKEKK